MTSAAFQTEMARLQDSHPRVKVEYVTPGGITTTDITAYYKSGARFEQIKERAPDEIQAGDFDIVLFNHDNNFSELVATSLFYNAQYHGGAIRVYEGFVLPDGTVEYLIQAVGYIDSIETSQDDGTITLRCRDIIRAVLDQTLHGRPRSEVVTPGTNAGDGIISAVETKPFKTVNEDWTVTCTLGGTDGVATFSVVGSVTGSAGTATSGVEFSTVDIAGGIKFSIASGATDFVVGDVFTFSTKQYPQWSGVNAGKIVWSIMTGYNWDTDTEEAWSDFVFGFDHTQSSANTDLDYDAFSDVIDTLDDLGSFDLTGYIDYDETAVDVLQGIILQFLGSIYTGSDGRMFIKAYAPVFDSTTPTAFADSIKISRFGYERTVDEIINRVTVSYKATDSWQFSDEDFDYDGFYVAENDDSIDRYNNSYGQDFQIKWFSPGAQHVIGLAERLVTKYADPPFEIDFTTGLDALLTEIGDVATVTDTKYGFSAVVGEVCKITKNFDDEPSTIDLRLRRDSDFALVFGFIGSEADEGDGISPQADDYDSASTTDKLFAYLGSSSTDSPSYRMF